MSENVIIAIIGSVGTITGAIVGTIGAMLIAKMNHPPQGQNASLPPSSGSLKMKVALITAVVGLAAGLSISFWMFSGKASSSQENVNVTAVTTASDPVQAQEGANTPNSATVSKPMSSEEATSVMPTPKVEPIKRKEPAQKEEKKNPKKEPKKEKKKK